MPYDRISVINNCVIGSVPGHPIIKECLDSLKYHRTCPDVLSRTGPIHFQEAFYSVAKDLEVRDKASGIIALPKSFFFPYREGEEPGTLEEMQALIKPKTFGIHYWAGSWVDSENLKLHKTGKKRASALLQDNKLT